MNKGFFLKLSVEEQQVLSKIILFVNANTKLKIDYQENFIKFAFSLNEPSIFYISKNTNGKIFVKFKKLENVSEKPDEKEFLPNEELMNFTTEDWHALTEEKFTDLFENSAVKRTGFNGLSRNLSFIKTEFK